MILKTIITVATLSLILLASTAFAGEGAGDPFPFRAPPQVSTGRAIIADTGSEQFPALTGEVVQPQASTAMAATNGREGPVTSLNSLPRGFEEGTVAYAQSRRLQQNTQAVAARRLALQHNLTID